MESAPSSPKSYKSSANLNAAADAVSKMSGSGMELMVYEKTGIGNGQQANNPWLQELPDPVSKVTWDNYLSVFPKDARDNSWKQGNVVEVKANGISMKVPVVVQPGQMPGTCSLAVGYGRTAAGKVADGVGVALHAAEAGAQEAGVVDVLVVLAGELIGAGGGRGR